jgi:hypothetical protein
MGGLQASPPGASPLTVLALCWISTDAVGWVPRDPTQAGVAGGGASRVVPQARPRVE